MKKLCASLFVLSLLFFLPGIALADGGYIVMGDHLQLTVTQAQTLPYEFEPLDVTPSDKLDLPSFSAPNFINAVGSYAVTVWALLDYYNVLGIFVVIMLALSALWWLYRFVTNRAEKADLNLSGAVDQAADAGILDDETANQTIKVIRYF